MPPATFHHIASDSGQTGDGGVGLGVEDGRSLSVDDGELSVELEYGLGESSVSAALTRCSNDASGFDPAYKWRHCGASRRWRTTSHVGSHEMRSRTHNGVTEIDDVGPRMKLACARRYLAVHDRFAGERAVSVAGSHRKGGPGTFAAQLDAAGQCGSRPPSCRGNSDWTYS